MSRKELLEELESLANETHPKFKYGMSGWDDECSHIRADEILLELLGDPQVSEIFERIHKWYA